MTAQQAGKHKLTASPDSRPTEWLGRSRGFRFLAVDGPARWLFQRSQSTRIRVSPDRSSVPTPFWQSHRHRIGRYSPQRNGTMFFITPGQRTGMNFRVAVMSGDFSTSSYAGWQPRLGAGRISSAISRSVSGADSVRQPGRPVSRRRRQLSSGIVGKAASSSRGAEQYRRRSVELIRVALPSRRPPSRIIVQQVVEEGEPALAE